MCTPSMVISCYLHVPFAHRHYFCNEAVPVPTYIPVYKSSCFIPVCMQIKILSKSISSYFVVVNNKILVAGFKPANTASPQTWLPRAESGSRSADVCKSGDAHLSKYFPLEKRKKFLTFQLFSLHSSRFCRSFFHLFFVCFLPSGKPNSFHECFRSLHQDIK